MQINDENMSIINKTKQPTKGRKKVQDERTQVLTNKESFLKCGSQGEHEQIKHPNPLNHNKHII
jgi:hypothetical protein